MTGHDDREGIPSERLADRARRAGRSETGRDLAVGERRPRGDRARRSVDAAVERRHVRHVERDRRKIAPCAAQEGHDGRERALDRRRRRRLASGRKAPAQAGARTPLASLGEL